jgi:hypothetical protein
VHLAGGVGAALLVAAAWAAALRTPPGPRGRLVRGLLALHAGLLVAHHRQAQADYARAWTAQRAFWPQVAALVPDLDEGLLVFAEGPPEPPAQALAHGWSDAMVLERLWRLPAAWRTPPRLFYVAPGWQGAVRREGGVAVWTVPAATVAAHPEPLPPGKVVLLVEQAPGRWSRRAGELWTPAGPVQLRPPGPPVRLEPGPLAPFLLD